MDAVLLFLKYPTPGRVKTRLAATVGVETATRIYTQLVHHVCATLPPEATPVVMFDPPESEQAMRDWLSPRLSQKAQFAAQVHGDLGARLQHGFGCAFDHGFQRVAAIGSDCVDLTPELFAQAFDELRNHDAVFGPAWDGGYYLVALARRLPELFENIAWSSEQTLSDTLRCAQEYRLTMFLLEKKHDVDTEEDWLRVQRTHPFFLQ